LLRFAGGEDGSVLGFVPASTAVRLSALGSLVPLPAAPPPVAGIALAEGVVVTVLRLGELRAGAPPPEPGDEWPIPGAGRAVICKVGALEVALTGGTVVATGLFEAAPGGIVWRGQMVPTLDVRALYAQAEAATWAGRAASARPSAPARPAPSDEGRRATYLPGDLFGDDEGETR
jgi:hypothetical protein